MADSQATRVADFTADSPHLLLPAFRAASPEADFQGAAFQLIVSAVRRGSPAVLLSALRRRRGPVSGLTTRDHRITAATGIAEFMYRGTGFGLRTLCRDGQVIGDTLMPATMVTPITATMTTRPTLPATLPQPTTRSQWNRMTPPATPTTPMLCHRIPRRPSLRLRRTRMASPWSSKTAGLRNRFTIML